MMDNPKYKRHWEEKQVWYNKNYPHQLVTTEESQDLSKNVLALIIKIKQQT